MALVEILVQLHVIRGISGHIFFWDPGVTHISPGSGFQFSHGGLPETHKS